jgi:ABC-type transport system substrate-binding protein
VRNSRRRSFLLVVALVAGTLAGCQPAATPTALTAPAEPTAIAVASPSTVAATSPATAAVSPTARPLRTALEATDPTTVSLANGQPTLVEFFAFW